MNFIVPIGRGWVGFLFPTTFLTETQTSNDLPTKNASNATTFDCDVKTLFFWQNKDYWKIAKAAKSKPIASHLSRNLSNSITRLRDRESQTLPDLFTIVLSHIPKFIFNEFVNFIYIIKNVIGTMTQKQQRQNIIL